MMNILDDADEDIGKGIVLHVINRDPAVPVAGERTLGHHPTAATIHMHFPVQMAERMLFIQIDSPILA